MLNWLGRSLLLAGLFSVLGVQVVGAEEISPLAPLNKGGTNPEVPLKKGELGGSSLTVQKETTRVRNLQRPTTSVAAWLAQVEATSSVRVTSVKLTRTQTGLEITLETADAKPLQVDATRAEGNSLITDIPNAVLALPEGEAFSADNPTSEITSVRVVQQDASNIQVTVTGNNALPVSEVTLITGEFAYSLNPEADESDEEIEIVVTGEQEEGYRVPDTSVGTRTDTPLRDIPQSIQIVPQQVLEEQQVNTLNEALRNAPGVTQTAPNYIPGFQAFTIRGFLAGENQGNFTRNGLPYEYTDGPTAFSNNIQRIEVLSGPASVLFGGGNPGGTINIVTKQPLRDPFYSVEATIGSYDFYQGAIDLTGSLNDSGTILYRLNASYEYADSFADFTDRESSAVASVLKFEIGENTDITFDLEYSKINQGDNYGLPAVGTVLPNPNGEIPRNRNTSDEDSEYSPEVFRVGYNLEHRFSENWSLQNAFYFSELDFKVRNGYFALSLEPDLRTLERGVGDFDNKDQSFDLFTNIVGKFSTGSIQHQLLFGVDLRRVDNRNIRTGSFRGTSLDLFNPVYSLERFERIDDAIDETTLTDSLGIYLQDQVTLADNFKLLLGGRFDAFGQTNEDFINETEESQSGDAFSPRLGIVYQPIEPISLYASYTRSFSPSYGRSFDGEPFEPGRGTQYEIGVKADINEQLSATLALYDLTRTNVNTTDPDNPDFEIQTGEQNSQGIELNIVGEILPGWNVIAGYAYTDARITEDETYEVGNRLNNVPESSFNLWTSYEIQEGDLQGLGFGLGFFYVGDRQGDLDNSFTLPSYFRTDAAIFYNRDQFRAALNFRNLFDIDYFESAYSDLSVYPGEPFTVQGTISWQF